jgi:hypothetical protein
MIYVYMLIITILSALLWRIRGGLWKDIIPANKIWYAVAFAVYGCFYFGPSFENFIVGFIACYTSYQLYGWGLYVGNLLMGDKPLNPETDRECELIDDLLYGIKFRFKGKTIYLYEYPRLFGFCGTTLTGLIITFLWGLFTGNLVIMLSGLSMGVCYWIGGKLEKLYALGKGGWNWGEIIWGAVEGAVLALMWAW